MNSSNFIFILFNENSLEERAIWALDDFRETASVCNKVEKRLRDSLERNL